MEPQAKLGLFAAGIAVVFGTALGIGALVGDPAPEPETKDHASMDMSTDMQHGESHAPAGLSDSEHGYTLTDVTAPAAAGQAGQLTFRIVRDGAPVTGFDTVHDKQLHLIVVRSDTAEFRHVHPTMNADGRWSIDWTWPTGGTYRVFTDFTPTGGSDLTLGRSVDVAGDAAFAPIPAPAKSAVVDGYSVALTGDLRTAGGMLDFTVTRDGKPVVLEPYLGAAGHLVALRTSDLAYLHVHPQGEPGGPEVAFHAEAPSAGQYRLFLDFKVDGVVRTAEFTAEADQR